MRALTFVILATLGFSAAADDSSEYAGGWKRVGRDAMRTHFRLRGDVYLLDGMGTRFLAPTSEIREWRAGIKSNQIENFWSVTAKGFKGVALHHVWTLNEDNSVNYVIEQCESIKTGTPSRCVKVIRREAKTLENFAPVTWVAESTAEARVIVRFTPSFDETRELEDLTRIPIGGERGSFDVYDNQGHLWSERTRLGGVVSGLKSPFGSLIFSFYPFPGAREIGRARGKYIEINATDKLMVTLRNETEVVPGELRIKVYGKYLPNLKSKNGTYSFGHDSADTVPAEFR